MGGLVEEKGSCGRQGENGVSSRNQDSCVLFNHRRKLKLLKGNKGAALGKIGRQKAEGVKRSRKLSVEWGQRRENFKHCVKYSGTRVPQGMIKT